jgi:crotonobetainyl-CoA:carnitine CoA-transferase CaiB-like acyl-CoA transferase
MKIVYDPPEMTSGPLRVVDLSTGLAGGYCTKLLADSGSDVVKVEPPGGDPLRKWSASGARPDGEDGALFQYLHASKRSIVGTPADEPVRALLAAADVVVEGPNATLTDADGARFPEHLVVVSISPWGRTGPWADRPWSEFVLQAEGGSIAGRGLPGGVPFQAGGRTVEWGAGTYAALAALAAAREARRTGSGERVDVSMLEAATIVCSNYGDLYRRVIGYDPSLAPAAGTDTPSIEPTADGYVGFTTLSRQQFDDFLVLIERPDLLGDERLAMVHGRTARFQEWSEIVAAWTTKHTTDEIMQKAAALRVPVAPVGNGATVVTHEQFVARNVFVKNPSGSFRQPRPPYRIGFEAPDAPGAVPALDADAAWPGWPSPTDAPDAAVAKRLPLEGVRIVDLTAWWAGPAATHVLATLGADVIHVEAVTRPDGMRMAGGILASNIDAWWEYSSHFLAVNNNKRGITVNITDPRGVELVKRLVAVSDAVVDNFTPRVLDGVGLTWEVIQEVNPRAIMQRMPAFGLDGPWRDRPGFAQTMEQLTGLAWLTGHADDQPRVQRGPCDPIAGVHAALAFLVALDERDRTGRGVHVESTLAEAALNVGAEQIVEHAAYGVLLQRDGNRSPGSAPQGLYPAAGGTLALSITSDEEWAALMAVVGKPPLPADELESYDGRRRHHDELDAWLREIASAEPADALVERLASAGVPAGLLRDPRLLSEHPQLVARHLFEQSDHPVVGTHPIPMLPFRFASVERWCRFPAPTVGQHNDEVLGGLLGLTVDELASLTADRVIGTKPFS